MVAKIKLIQEREVVPTPGSCRQHSNHQRRVPSTQRETISVLQVPFMKRERDHPGEAGTLLSRHTVSPITIPLNEISPGDSARNQVSDLPTMPSK